MPFPHSMLELKTAVIFQNFKQILVPDGNKLEKLHKSIIKSFVWLIDQI